MTKNKKKQPICNNAFCTRKATVIIDVWDGVEVGICGICAKEEDAI